MTLVLTMTACSSGDDNNNTTQCPESLPTQCGTECVNTLSNPSHCGACNNACPHLNLPFFEKRPLEQTGVITSPGQGREVPRDSWLTDDLGLVCRWHETCFDVQTGAVREWTPTLQADGTSPGWEFIGDISKNRAPIKPLPCLVREGTLWVALN